jgi:hypothetical protein
MSIPVTLTNIGSAQQITSAATTINNNNTAITNALSTGLSTQPSTPNSMNTILDMNNQRIINLPSPGSLSDPVRLGDLNVTAPAVTFGSPSNKVGLIQNNGVLNLALRADATPALDQTIAPTWTGVHTFSTAPIINTLGLSNLTIFTANGLSSGIVYIDAVNLILTSNTNSVISNMVIPSGAPTHKFATAISGTGVITWTQPAAADLSNGVTGSGTVVLSVAPALTGTTTAAALTLSGLLTVGTTLGVTGLATLTGGATSPLGYTALNATATTSGGAVASVVSMGTAGIGIYFGSSAPTITAPQGSIYLRTDGTTTNNRMYVNTNGSTTWTAVTTVA